MGVLPTRSPIPNAVPCTRVAPLLMAASVLLRSRPRSRCPCQSTPTSTPSSSIKSLTQPTRFMTPSGTAAPTVSHRQTRCAPASMAAVSSTRRSSGDERTVSSVTYITGRFSPTAKPTASLVKRRMWSRSHSSAYWRTGLEPIKTQASMGMPVSWLTSAMGWMSTIRVRAAQLGRMFIRLSEISRQSRVTDSSCLLPAPGKPISAVSMPSRSIRWSISTLVSSDGSITEGDCSPSRSVSSSSITCSGQDTALGPWLAQSKISWLSSGCFTTSWRSPW